MGTCLQFAIIYFILISVALVLSPAGFFSRMPNLSDSLVHYATCMAEFFLLQKKLPNINKNGLEHCNLEPCVETVRVPLSGTLC